MDTLRPAFINYEGVIWFVDLAKMQEDLEISIINPDGTRRPATKEDGNLMDVLMYGHVLEEQPIKVLEKDPLVMKIKKFLLKEEKPKTNLFDSIVKNPNLKKPKTDYGALTVKALKRMK